MNPTLLFLALLALLLVFKVVANCKTGCDLALASYNIWEGVNLTYISTLFTQNIAQILPYNIPNVPNQDSLIIDSRISIPFSCDCLNGDFLGHTFSYTTQSGDTYSRIAKLAFANLTTEDWVHRVNTYDTTRIPDGALINVTLNCSCGDKRVSENYGLFSTYPLKPGQNLSSVAAESGVPAELLLKYNSGVNFSTGSGIVYLPAKDATGNYPPLKKSAAGIIYLEYSLDAPCQFD